MIRTVSQNNTRPCYALKCDIRKFFDSVDHDLKVKYYARYTDDFIVVSTDKKYLEDLITPIQSFLRTKLYLELHPKKVHITKHVRGIDFLGYVILPEHIKIRTKTKRKIPKKIQQMVERYKQGRITELTLYSSLQSYLGVLSHANAYNLSQEIQNKFWFWLKE